MASGAVKIASQPANYSARLTYFDKFAYLCPTFYLSNQPVLMKKTTALSSLLLLGSLGSLRYLSAQLASLNLTFHLHGEEDDYYL